MHLCRSRGHRLAVQSKLRTISASLLAWSRWSCSARSRAVACRSLDSISALLGFVGLMSAAVAVTVGPTRAGTPGASVLLPDSTRASGIVTAGSITAGFRRMRPKWSAPLRTRARRNSARLRHIRSPTSPPWQLSCTHRPRRGRPAPGRHGRCPGTGNLADLLEGPGARAMCVGCTRQPPFWLLIGKEQRWPGLGRLGEPKGIGKYVHARLARPEGPFQCS